MLATYRMFQYMIKQVRREMMLILLMVAPILIGIFFRLGVPFLEKNVLIRYGLESLLVPYYEIFSWILALVTGMLFAFIGGLVVLGELDENVAKYILVTPAGAGGYLVSRIILPAVVSGMAAILLIPIFALSEIRIAVLTVMVLSTVLSGIVTALLVVAISSNKVEGMAVGKLSGLFGMTFFLPLFVKGPIRYLFVLFPMYHIGDWAMEGGSLKLIYAAFLYIAWIYGLYVRFRKKFTR